MNAIRLSAIVFAAGTICCAFAFVAPCTSSTEGLYLFRKGTTLEYDVTYTYPGDTTYTVKRYYKVGEPDPKKPAAGTPVIYYKLNKDGKETILYRFSVSRNKDVTGIDILHLAAVYRDDSSGFGKDRLVITYSDSIDRIARLAEPKFVTSNTYFITKRSASKYAPVINHGFSYFETGISIRAAQGSEEVVLPFGTLLAGVSYYDVDRTKVTRTSTKTTYVYTEEREVLQSIHFYEWYVPEYGVVKREIQNPDDNIEITMNLVAVHL